MIKPMLILAASMLAAPVMAQDTAAPAAAPSLPVCSAKVTDSCIQSAAAERRAMTAEQAAARDARIADREARAAAKAAAKAEKAAPKPM